MKFNNLQIIHSKVGHVLSFLTTILLFAISVCAQDASSTKPKPSPEPAAQAAAPTFDSLLGADTYKLYGEVRNVGQLLSTGGAGEIVDPIMKLADPPKEFKSLVKFLNANAEMLAGSRLMFATWPAKVGLPNAFVAIELSSPEDAAKFEPKLNRLLPILLPTPTPTPV